jgi:thiosulfate reductase cytochrome b subunit
MMIEPSAPPRRTRRLHPLPIRIMHWTNALAILMLLFSGLKIYDDFPLLGWLKFPDEITLGGHPETALLWHFFAMWIAMANGLVYLAYGLATGRLRRKLLPVDPREVVATIRDALRFHLAHDDLTRYNGVQKLLYLGIIGVIVLQVATGLAIWKPVQFSEFASLFGSFQTARILHFVGLVAIAGFLVVHVALAALVPETITAMVTGGPLDLEDAPSPSAPRSAH